MVTLEVAGSMGAPPVNCICDGKGTLEQGNNTILRHSLWESDLLDHLLDISALDFRVLY